MTRTIRSNGNVKRIFWAMALLVLVLAIGILGYSSIEDMSFTEAFYMTVITISTVGFKEVTPLSTAGMYFTAFEIVIGVSAMLFFLATVFEFILSEYLGDIWGRRKMSSSISRLSGHYIVCGYGRVGKSVAEELSSQLKQLVVIENETEAFRQCVEDGHLAILGTATENEVLGEAGIMSARGLVSALRSDADNLFVILSARTMNPDLLLVARAGQPESEGKLEQVGADRVISPHKIAGKRMAHLLVSPRVCEFLDAATAGNLPDYQLSEIRIDEESPLSGTTVKGSRMREKTGVTILAIRKGTDRAFNSNPPVDMLLEAGDDIIVIGTGEQMAKLQKEKIISFDR